jgi:hypothetical protein
MSRAMYRFRQRIASGLVGPSCRRRARYARVRGSQRNRDNAMVCNAVLAARSPPRFSRWRLVRPELAAIGVTPQRWANAASECSRSGLSPAVTRSWPATSMPVRIKNPSTGE